uniref:Uncharacterized protein n=1 Tax=Arundo donax TaxID=35708 RepID=A0A0A8YMV7_ARUDO
MLAIAVSFLSVLSMSSA